jgi:hypothetical protein
LYYSDCKTARLQDKKEMKNKKADKRLILPRDDFEDEASEGLGRLNRKEAQEDLQELRSRMERRLKRPWVVWVPAAAAFVIILIASAIYISLFRNTNVHYDGLAMNEEAIRDTVLIAMAEPIVRWDTILIVMAEPIIRTEVMVAQSGVTSRPGVNKPERIMVTVAEKRTMEKKSDAVQKEVTAVAEEPAGEVVVMVVPQPENTALQAKEQVADVAGAKARSAAATLSRTPSPVGGMDEFNLWIQKNIRYPADVEPGVRQEVVVTFKVAADSTVYDLRAENTPGDSFTREAFRLLSHGPKWIPVIRDNKVVGEEVRLSIVFK